MALQVCTTPGCPTLTPQGRCPTCTTQARRRRTPRTRAYDDPRWRRTRRAYLDTHPYCECDQCAEESMLLRPLAEHVHHIDGLGVLGPRAYDWSNLMSLTQKCHARITADEQPGGWHESQMR